MKLLESQLGRGWPSTSQTSPVHRAFWMQVLGEGAREATSKMPEKPHGCGVGGQVCVARGGHQVPPSPPDVPPPPGACSLLSPPPSLGFLHGKALGPLPSPIPSFSHSSPLPFLPSVVVHGVGCLEELLGVRMALHVAPSAWGHREPGGAGEAHREGAWLHEDLGTCPSPFAIGSDA